jgi:hypothetical protein
MLLFEAFRPTMTNLMPDHEFDPSAPGRSSGGVLLSTSIPYLTDRTGIMR